MPILKIRDENGNFVPIPALQGSDGKSAYDQAKEGGYTGTEEEFIAFLNGLLNPIEVVSEEPSHYTDYNNPHKVTAAQVGALPELYYSTYDLNTELQQGGGKVRVCCYNEFTQNTPYTEGLTDCTHGMVITNAFSSDYSTQICTPSGEDSIYIRRINGSGISRWVKMASIEQVNTLISELSSVSAYINNSVVPRLDAIEPKTGSYTGTGTTSNQEITIGGSGNILMITSSNNDLAFVHAYGAHSYPNNASDFSVKQSNAKFENGVLTLVNTSYAGLNASGITYYYKVL